MRHFRNYSALLLLWSANICLAATCTVAQPHEPSPAEAAYLHSDYARAAALYQELLAKDPNRPDLTAALSNVLLHQQKFAEANELLGKALQANPQSTVLLAAAGFAQLRGGTPWTASESAARAIALDPCNPRAHLLESSLLRLNSRFKSAAAELQTAHSIDPYDPEIREQWLVTLPLKQRIQETEDFLSGANALDADDQKHWRFYLEHLQKLASQGTKPCQLVSRETSTELPFAFLMRDATHVQSFGLDVKLNNQSGRLQIDTGAGGLTISPALARRAGLERFSEASIGGVGSEGEQSAYTAIVDSIRVGSLEFHNCSVEVVKSRLFTDGDGLIGMNVFSRMLVTLDYPMRKVVLGPLPPRPDETAAAQTATLDTSGDEDTADTVKQNSGPHDRYIAPEMKDWSKVYRLGHLLITQASLNRSTTKLFVLDTGAFATTISPEAASEVTKIHKDSTTVRGLSGKVDKVYTTGDLEFQFANIRQPTHGVFAFDTSRISKNLGLEISGFIGITTLDKLRLTIDYRDGLVHFEYDPNRGYRN